MGFELKTIVAEPWEDWGLIDSGNGRKSAVGSNIGGFFLHIVKANLYPFRDVFLKFSRKWRWPGLNRM